MQHFNVSLRETIGGEKFGHETLSASFHNDVLTLVRGYLRMACRSTGESYRYSANKCSWQTCVLTLTYEYVPFDVKKTQTGTDVSV